MTKRPARKRPATTEATFLWGANKSESQHEWKVKVRKRKATVQPTISLGTYRKVKVKKHSFTTEATFS